MKGLTLEGWGAMEGDQQRGVCRSEGRTIILTFRKQSKNEEI
jgi:hypothetical protein